MKKSLLFIGTFVLALTLGLVSCNKDDDDGGVKNDSEAVGTWEYGYFDGSDVWTTSTTYDDMVITESSITGGVVSSVTTSTYEYVIKGGNIYYTWKVAGVSSTYYLYDYTIDGDYMYLDSDFTEATTAVTKDGATLIYKKK